MTRTLRHALIGSALLAAATAATAQAGATVDAVRARGETICGVSLGIAGFSIADSAGQWTGLTADFCRAVSTAILGDAAKEKFVPLSPQQRFTAVQSGEVDVLATNATWTLTRDASLGLLFAGVYFYDGQGFMVPKDLGVASALELDGANICMASGTTNELSMADYFRANGKAFTPVVFESQNEAREAFFNGRCQAFSADQSYLYSIRATSAGNPDDWLVLPEVISKEPLGPVTGRTDLEMFTIVKWTLMLLAEAEERGVTAANVDEMKANSQDPGIQRMLGTAGDMGEKLGLDAEWGYRVIKRVGNYGEMFARNLGPDTPFKMERGLNALWGDGGLIYAMPMR